MRTRSWIAVLAATAIWPILSQAENLTKEVKKAVERSTLDQPGTKPFHLKAVITPSFERDKELGRTGEVEIWWASPTRWKREVRSPEFHQIEVVDGAHDWQKNEGDYFPEWLQETALELVKPVPPIDGILEHVKTAEIHRFGPMTSLDWTTTSGTAEVPNIFRSWIAFQGNTGLLLHAGGLGWGGEFKDYSSFHDRMIARTVNVGSPQVTAKVATLEDLNETSAGFFDTSVNGGDPQPLETVLIDETLLRRNLMPMETVHWPPLQDGPLEGNVTTEVVIDRDGKIRELGPVVSENSGVNEVGKQAIAALRFKPFVINGVPVQVMSQLTLPFKTVRPSYTESFESARTYFERFRQVNFPAAGNGTPYVLRAEFDVKGKDGTAEKGRYEDTWLSDSQWRREAWFGNSQYVRSRNGKKSYQWADGQHAGLLRLVLKVMEPIPAIDTFTESDWRIKRDIIDGVPTIRMLTGYESPDGQLDPVQAMAYWFDDTGVLIKAHLNGVDTQRSEFDGFAGVKIAHRIDVLKDGLVGMRIHITDVTLAGKVSSKTFEVRGHEWTRAFTAEVR